MRTAKVLGIGKAFRIFLGAVVVVYCLLIFRKVTVIRLNLQWDLEVYRAAGKAILGGGNPMDVVSGEGLKFYYPITAWPFCALTAMFGKVNAYFLFLYVKVFALATLCWNWSRNCIIPHSPLCSSVGPAWVLVFVCIFGFNGAIYQDLMSGNVAIFEQLFLWLGFVYALREKWGRYVFFVTLAASFKGVLFVFLGIPLVMAGLRVRVLILGIVLLAAGLSLWSGYYEILCAMPDQIIVQIFWWAAPVITASIGICGAGLLLRCRARSDVVGMFYLLCVLVALTSFPQAYNYIILIPVAVSMILLSPGLFSPIVPLAIISAAVGFHRLFPFPTVEVVRFYPWFLALAMLVWFILRNVSWPKSASSSVG